MKVIGTKLPESKNAYQISGINIQYLNRHCRDAFLNLIQEGAGFKILKFIKRGLFDINQILYNDTNQCLLLSVLTGLIYNLQKRDFKSFLYFLKNNFKSTVDLKRYFYNVYNLDEKIINNFGNNQFNLLAFLSTKLQRKICIFSAKDGLNLNYQLTYSTKGKVGKRAIKIVIMDNHCYFLFTNKNIQFKATEFCDYCCKSYSNIKLHKCIFEKCLSCLRYKKTKNITDINDYCIKDYSYTSKFCPSCMKDFNNLECKSIHSSFSKTLCKSTLFCSKCQILHQDKNHICELHFCRKCFTHHKESVFCNLRVKQIQRTQGESFLIHYLA